MKIFIVLFLHCLKFITQNGKSGWVIFCESISILKRCNLNRHPKNYNLFLPLQFISIES